MINKYILDKIYNIKRLYFKKWMIKIKKEGISMVWTTNIKL